MISLRGVDTTSATVHCDQAIYSSISAMVSSASISFMEKQIVKNTLLKERESCG
jgi:hypothetical protein